MSATLPDPCENNMMTDIHALLNDLRELEERERSLKSALAEAESESRSLKAGLADARNAVKGYESQPDHPRHRAALGDCEQLEPLLAAVEARVADLGRQLQEVRTAKAEIEAGPDRAAVFALRYREAEQQADAALAALAEAVQRHQVAEAERVKAAAAGAAAEQARSKALDPAAMTLAHAALVKAQTDLGAAEALVANLARLVEDRRAGLRKATTTLAAAHQRAWKARYDDALAALGADRDRLHTAFAAGVASGAVVQNFTWFAREVLAVAVPAPPDLKDLLDPMAEALGVPARLPKFAPV